MSKDDSNAFWKEEYRKAKAGEKTIADTMPVETLDEFKRKPKPTTVVPKSSYVHPDNDDNATQWIRDTMNCAPCSRGSMR